MEARFGICTSHLHASAHSRLVCFHCSVLIVQYCGIVLVVFYCFGNYTAILGVETCVFESYFKGLPGLSGLSRFREQEVETTSHILAIQIPDMSVFPDTRHVCFDCFHLLVVADYL